MRIIHFTIDDPAGGQTKLKNAFSTELIEY